METVRSARAGTGGTLFTLSARPGQPGQVRRGVAGGIDSPGGRRPAGADNFSPRAGVDCTSQGLGGLYPQGGQLGVTRRGRWPAERGPGMFVFVVSFAPDTVSRLLLLRLSLPSCVWEFPFPLPRALHFSLKLFLATTPVSISTHSKAFLERSQFDRRIKGPYRCCIAGWRTNWKKVCFLFCFFCFFCCLRNNLRHVLMRPRGVRDERVRAWVWISLTDGVRGNRTVVVRSFVRSWEEPCLSFFVRLIGEGFWLGDESDVFLVRLPGPASC